MNLGAFSISLNVRDIAASRQFYQALGFEAVHDNHAEGWMILRNGDTTLGLFEGIIPANTMTFNPGWDAEGRPVDGEFDDVRTLQKRLKQAGVELSAECDEATQGPAHIALTDPDGNAILIDQHR